MNRSCHHTPVSAIKRHSNIPWSCKGHPKIGGPIPSHVPRLQLTGHGETSTILYAESSFNSKPPAGIIMAIKTVALTISTQKTQLVLSLLKQLRSVCRARRRSFSRSEVHVCEQTRARTRAPVCRERAGDAYRRTGDVSCKLNCSSVTSQIITSYACFFTLECLFCNQDIQVSASFWRIWSLSEITVQIKAFYSY